ncbi:MAG: leucine-rich repeat protein [Lachnospira sp.]|nr:leucine-rich repeat protein [Lachnospira sp.]
MEEVIFPDSLEEIGQEAFINCVNLKSAVYKKGVKVDPTSFKGCIQLER